MQRVHQVEYVVVLSGIHFIFWCSSLEELVLYVTKYTYLSSKLT